MRSEKFWFETSIIKHLEQNYPADTKFSVVDVSYFWRLWKCKTVIFYQQKDIVQLLEGALFDLFVDEWKINIKSLQFDFPDWKNENKVLLNLSTENDPLLVGKFKQNHQSLELFFTFFLSNLFKIKWEVKLVFSQLNKKKRVVFSNQKKQSSF